MMFYDKPKLLGTLAGVVFAVLLSIQQLSVLFGLLDKNTMLVDHSGADIWITPPGTDELQPGEPLSDAVLIRARTTRGVAIAEPLVLSGGSVKRPDGGTEPVTLVGTRPPAWLGGPWALVDGTTEALLRPDTVIFEDSRRKELGGINPGSRRELNEHLVTVGGFTWGLLPFAPAYAFAELGLARRLTHMPGDNQSFVLVGVRKGADPDEVAKRLARRLPNTSVMTTVEFHDSIVGRLLANQLGVSFGTATAFGLLIGFIVVSLSMFSSVLDHLQEFGMLKAIGCTNGELTWLLVAQSVAYAFFGSLIGLSAVVGVANGIRSAQLVPSVPHALFFIAPVVMLVLCVLASSLALLRVRGLEPGMVFR